LTEDRNLYISGNNGFGQLCLGEEKGKIVPFFPELRKIDFFDEVKVSVTDVVIGFCHGHALGIDQETGKKRIFGFGNA
jgi:hypothetical protein